MGCNNCKENQDPNCGCTSEALHINQICNPIECPSDECAESFSAACIRYTGEPLVCNNVEVVSTDTNVAQALSNIMAFICTNDVVDADIVCGQTVIIPQGTEIGQALGLIVSYFCGQLLTIGDLACPESPILVPANTPLNEAIESIFEYFCQQVLELNIAISEIIIPEIIAGSGITVTPELDGLGNVISYTIDLVPIVIPVTTLTNAGGITSFSLVNDGSGPSLAVKGIKAGPGIGLTVTATEITITNAAPDEILNLLDGDDIEITGTYPNLTITATGVKEYTNVFVSPGIGGTVAIPHNLGLGGYNAIVSVIQGGGLPPWSAFVHGVDYTYTLDSPNQITITDITGGLGTFRVSVYGKPY